MRRLEAIRSSRSRDETGAEAGELEDEDEDYSSAAPSSDAVEGESAPPTPLLFTTSPGRLVVLLHLCLHSGFIRVASVDAGDYFTGLKLYGMLRGVS